MTRPPTCSRHPRRRGMVLLIVLIVVVMLSLSAYTFCDLMLTSRESVELSGRQLQAEALADSGIDMLRTFLTNDAVTREEMGGFFDNPSLLQAVPVLEDSDPRYRGNFTILAPSLDEQGYLAGLRYGLEDESTRLNLNALVLADGYQENGGRQLLMALPGMTEDVADAILDWVDEDDEPRDYGAESEYYSSLNPPYAPKNGPLETVEELLLVRGVSPTLLFGIDVNRNGSVDSYELQGPLLPSTGSLGGASGTPGSASSQANDLAASTDAEQQRGWAAFLTLYSLESNLNSQGLPRIDVNMEDMEQLYEELREVFADEWASFIVAYRQFGPGEEAEDEEDEEKRGGQQEEVLDRLTGDSLDLSQPGKFPLSQALDLIGVKIRMQIPDEKQMVTLKSPFSTDLGEMVGYLPPLMDNITVNPAETIPGRINVNQASRTILAGLPGMTEEIMEQLLQARATVPSDQQAAGQEHETWLLTSAVVSLEEMKELYPFVNAGGDAYRAQVVGYFEDGGASARYEVVCDASTPLPRLVFWRDMSHLGRGYALETLGVHLLDGF